MCSVFGLRSIKAKFHTAWNRSDILFTDHEVLANERSEFHLSPFILASFLNLNHRFETFRINS